MALGCAGQIGASEPDEPGAPSAGDPTPPAGAGAATAPGASTGGSTPAPTGGAAGRPCGGLAALVPAPMRRLTRLEYDNSVRDLLGVTGVRDSYGIGTRPSTALPDDDRSSGFESNASVPLTRLHAERYQ
jgi:hypothetical protein